MFRNTYLCIYLAAPLKTKISFRCIHFGIHSEYDAIAIKVVDTNAKPILKVKVLMWITNLMSNKGCY